MIKKQNKKMDFIKEVENAIFQIKEIFYLPNLKKIKEIFPLYRYNQLNRAFPYFFMFNRKNILGLESLNKLSFYLNCNKRGTLEHLINILNFGGLKVETLMNFYYEINYAIPSISLKPFIWIKQNEILYREIYQKFKEIFQSLTQTERIKIVKKFPTNYFIFYLAPYYNLNETIWYPCFKEELTIEEVIENIIRANTPVEIKFSITLLIGERIKERKLIKEKNIFSQHTGDYSFVSNTNLNKSKLKIEIFQ